MMASNFCYNIERNFIYLVSGVFNLYLSNDISKGFYLQLVINYLYNLG